MAEDLEKFISVKATGANQVSWELKTYCSELPVVYVDTEDGREITSNTVAKDAVIRIQGNAEFNDPADWYEGATTIKGRGNSTWSEGVSKGKKPYKLKLLQAMQMTRNGRIVFTMTGITRAMPLTARATRFPPTARGMTTPLFP